MNLRLIVSALAVLALPLGLSAGDTDDGAALPSTPFVYFNPDASALPPVEIMAGLEQYAVFLRSQDAVDLRPILFLNDTDLEDYLMEEHIKGTDMPWLAALHGGYLLTRGFRFGYEPLVCATVDGDIVFDYSIIVRRDSAFMSVNDLAATRIAVDSIGADVVDWYNVLMFRNEIDMRSYFDSLVETRSPASTVMAVLYKQVDAAIVPRYLFDRMSAASVTVWSALRVIETSRSVTLGGVAVWRGAPKEYVDRVRQLLTSDLRHQQGGQGILDAFYIDGMTPCSWEDYERLDGAYLRSAGINVPDDAERNRIVAAMAAAR